MFNAHKRAGHHTLPSSLACRFPRDVVIGPGNCNSCPATYPEGYHPEIDRCQETLLTNSVQLVCLMCSYSHWKRSGWVVAAEHLSTGNQIPRLLQNGKPGHSAGQPCLPKLGRVLFPTPSGGGFKPHLPQD